jgi:O-antigen/teichoic acid export membrane protein
LEFALRSIRLLGFRVFTVASMLAITVLTARWLGPEGRGIFALVLLASSIGVTFLGGMGSALAYEISNLGRPQRAVVANAVALALAIGLLALLGTVVLYFIWEDADLWWLVVAGAAQPPLLVGAALTWALLGADDHAGYNRAIIAPSALLLVFLVLLLGPGQLGGEGESSVLRALVAWLLAQCATVAWLLWLGRRRWLPLALRAVTPAAVAGMAGFGLQTGLADLISFFNYRADVFLLELFRGTDEVGVYSVAVQVAEGLWFISSAIGVAIYARVGQLSREEAAELTARSMRHALFIIFLLAVAAMVVAWIAFPLAFGTAYDDAVLAFWLLAPGIWIFGLGRIFSTFFTNALGRPRVPLLVAATSLGISVPLCFVLIPSLGMNGAAIATSVSYAASMVLAIVVFARETGIPPRRMLLVTGDDLREYVRFLRHLRSLLGATPSPDPSPAARERGA